MKKWKIERKMKSNCQKQRESEKESRIYLRNTKKKQLIEIWKGNKYDEMKNN